jgi:hypothetical protein
MDNVVTKMIWIMQWYCWNEWIVDDVFVDVDVTLLWVGRIPWYWTSLSKESLCLSLFLTFTLKSPLRIVISASVGSLHNSLSKSVMKSANLLLGLL